MDTLGTILTRAMSEPEFAELLFADPETALADYDLSSETLATLKGLTRSKFEALSLEERKSLSTDFYTWHEDFVIIGNNS